LVAQGPLIAEKGAGQSMTQAARDALRRVDSVLSENATPLHDAIGTDVRRREARPILYRRISTIQIQGSQSL
jgi:hypothetical protein